MAGYSCLAISRLPLKPWFVTGFIDAEGTFSWSISKNSKSRLGWTLAPRFSICLSIRDLGILEAFQAFFGGIGVIKTSGNFAYYDINSIIHLAVLFAHLSRYPLVSRKQDMFAIFLIIYNMYVEKKHLTVHGFMLCVAYINILNKSVNLSVLLAITSKYGSLPLLTLCPVPVTYNFILNPQWIVGFVCGEGSFSYFTRTRTTANGDSRVDYNFIFEVSQLPIDSLLLQAILDHILLYSGVGTGSLISRLGAVSRIRFGSISSLQHCVLPFFSEYIPGHKGLQYSVWLEGVTLTMCDTKYSDQRQLKLAKITKRLSEL